jgi:hypothetical protein
VAYLVDLRVALGLGGRDVFLVVVLVNHRRRRVAVVFLRRGGLVAGGQGQRRRQQQRGNQCGNPCQFHKSPFFLFAIRPLLYASTDGDISILPPDVVNNFSQAIFARFSSGSARFSTGSTLVYIGDYFIFA